MVLISVLVCIWFKTSVEQWSLNCSDLFCMWLASFFLTTMSFSPLPHLSLLGRPCLYPQQRLGYCWSRCHFVLAEKASEETLDCCSYPSPHSGSLLSHLQKKEYLWLDGNTANILAIRTLRAVSHRQLIHIIPRTAMLSGSRCVKIDVELAWEGERVWFSFMQWRWPSLGRLTVHLKLVVLLQPHPPGKRKSQHFVWPS